MRFVTAEKDGRVFVGSVNDDLTEVIDLQAAEKELMNQEQIPNTMIDCITLGEHFTKRVEHLYTVMNDDKTKNSYTYPLSKVKLLAPIPCPRKNIFCVGKNYAEHAIELGSEDDIPEHVMLFSKSPTTVIGPDEVVLNHQNVTNQLDYEGELAVIIGKKGKGISAGEAMDYVFGYTIINDITARDLQARHKQFLLGKSLDTSCPMGPYVVHKAKIENPNSLRISTKVNGEVRQASNTEQFIFNIETIIAVISQGMTLEPGDIIATGTPAGVGKGFTPPRFLQPGDVIEISVEGVGILRNTIEG